MPLTARHVLSGTEEEDATDLAFKCWLQRTCAVRLFVHSRSHACRSLDCLTIPRVALLDCLIIPRLARLMSSGSPQPYTPSPLDHDTLSKGCRLVLTRPLSYHLMYHIRLHGPGSSKRPHTLPCNYVHPHTTLQVAVPVKSIDPARQDLV